MKHMVTMEQAADLLRDGKVGVIPTDTVYGLVARATDKEAVARLYAIKHRESKPGTVIAASIEQLVELGIPRRYLSAVEAYWPNPISIIIPCPDLEYLHLGKQSLAVRIPKDEAIQKLLEKTGALQTTSANQPGEPTATNIQEAIAYFDDEIDFYVDGGDISGQPASTVIQIIDDAVDVIREGAVRINEIGEIV